MKTAVQQNRMAPSVEEAQAGHLKSRRHHNMPVQPTKVLLLMLDSTMFGASEGAR